MLSREQMLEVVEESLAAHKPADVESRLFRPDEIVDRFPTGARDQILGSMETFRNYMQTYIKQAIRTIHVARVLAVQCKEATGDPRPIEEIADTPYAIRTASFMVMGEVLAGIPLTDEYLESLGESVSAETRAINAFRKAASPERN